MMNYLIDIGLGFREFLQNFYNETVFLRQNSKIMISKYYKFEI